MPHRSSNRTGHRQGTEGDSYRDLQRQREKERDEENWVNPRLFDRTICFDNLGEFSIVDVDLVIDSESSRWLKQSLIFLLYGRGWPSGWILLCGTDERRIGPGRFRVIIVRWIILVDRTVAIHPSRSILRTILCFNSSIRWWSFRFEHDGTQFTMLADRSLRIIHSQH